MVYQHAATAENERKSEEPSSTALRDGVAASEHQLDTVVAGPAECAEDEDVNAWQYEQVRFQVKSSGTRS